jgi:hypothetical protein
VHDEAQANEIAVAMREAVLRFAKAPSIGEK